MRNDGYFSPERPIWWLSREWALMLGGGRALLMQAAHPLTLAGVAEHSDYDSDPWGRLERTMEVVWRCVYGTRDEADAAMARVRVLHSRVNGTLREPLGPFPAGTPYSAEDPELLMWVHATLIDSALLMYRTYVGALSRAVAEGYYQDMRLLGELFGIPPGFMPTHLDGFYAYKRRMLASEQITATPLAREVCWVVLRPPLPLALRPVGLALNQISVGFLPGELRRQYGFGWDPARRAMLFASTQYVKRVALPLLPDFVRARSEARRAERRLAA